MTQDVLSSINTETPIDLQYEGPLQWLLPFMERTYSRLVPRDVTASLAKPSVPTAVKAFTTTIHANEEKGDSSITDLRVWHNRLSEYKRRKSAISNQAVTLVIEPPSPMIPGKVNWRSLGPSVVKNGQTVGSQDVAGRIVGLAVTSDGRRVYAASAAGGVFRSDDGGVQWYSLMDGFDLDPDNFASASLACGAIAIDPDDPDRVYVGTGEGDTLELFRLRITNSLPSYRGIGPIRSDDGGATWVTEATAGDSPQLAGEAFFALAIDPQDRENVIAATTNGLYQRTPTGDGQYEWARRRTMTHASVVVSISGNTKRFFAGKWGSGVFHSTEGKQWYTTGQNFPNWLIGRIAIGVRPNDPNLVYAFVADITGGVQGLYRLDGVGGIWQEVIGVPDVLPGKQGSYDLTIAVDPNDPNVVYLGGDRINVQPWSGSIWRCTIQHTATGYEIINSASIGTHAHADVHTLVHTPGISNALWCGTDGGVFLNADPTGTGKFMSRNEGLSCLHCNFIAQHPIKPELLLVGMQDNGTALTSSPPVWSYKTGGDGGYCLINWADPQKFLVFMNGRIRRTSDGGATWGGWDLPGFTMTQPLVGLPYDNNPAHLSNADVVAFGLGPQVIISDDFFATLTPAFTLPAGVGDVFALAFAAKDRLYIGTTTGNVFSAERSGNEWSTIQLDDSAAGPLGVMGLLTDVAVDWSDPSLASIYVVFGGMGDVRHVWRFNGTYWESRSGETGPNSLLDVEHNALVVDPKAPGHLYVGANIGVWHSLDGGKNWSLLQNGLPDAPVYDLQIHPTLRLLRASTYGRGVYEIPI